MAPKNFAFSFAFFLALIIFFHGFQSIEGRYLKDEVHGVISNNANTSTDMVVSTTGLPPPPPPPPAPVLGHGVDDFRPTDPGHSPGVGHSIQN
ncbi:hypothetical protein HN873_035439 [Arachis hypogaea]